jgi:hypothetical protein
MTTLLDDTVRLRFFAPLESALKAASADRRCPQFSDWEYLVSGVGRVIEAVQSGRDWVQSVRMWLDLNLSVGTFFQSLRSERRLALVEEVDRLVRSQLDGRCTPALDPLAEHLELDGFAVYASDGHYEEAGTHSRPVDGVVPQTGYFYSLNLRSHSMALLDIARPVHKKEHDMHVLKRLTTAQLRLGAPTGVKVLHVYDCAGIDYAQWLRWKAKGLYIISREKANSTADVLGLRSWDRDDPRNLGVLADELVGVFCGALLRRVHYRDPATGNDFSFMTSEMTLPPGLIAFLYKLRWDIEKFFDEKKNKLQETKTWATTLVARCQQAHFICLAHNLMVILERDIEANEGIKDQKLIDKRQKRLDELREQIRCSGRLPNTMVLKCARLAERSLQFIRWLRYCLRTPTSWRAGLDSLRPLMSAYLT